MPGVYQRIYALVMEVPRGTVATYGQIAKLVGCSARQAGYAMAAAPAESVPWHRIINSRGQISMRSGGSVDPEQRRLLENEGIQFDSNGRIDLTCFQWQGPDQGWWADQAFEPPLV